MGGAHRYDVAGLISGKSSGLLSEWTPALNVYDTETHLWIPAKETCPPAQRYDKIDHEHHMCARE